MTRLKAASCNILQAVVSHFEALPAFLERPLASFARVLPRNAETWRSQNALDASALPLHCQLAIISGELDGFESHGAPRANVQYDAGSLAISSML
jgi:predicted lipoprotein